MKKKEGGEHHIATDHGSMVQGGLLTVHPGSIHGGGEAPRGDSSLRQGAGKRNPSAPDLGARRRRNRGEIAKKGSVFGGFASRRLNRRRGAARGPLGVQAPPLAWPDPRPCQVAAWV